RRSPVCLAGAYTTPDLARWDLAGQRRRARALAAHGKPRCSGLAVSCRTKPAAPERTADGSPAKATRGKIRLPVVATAFHSQLRRRLVLSGGRRSQWI